MTPDALALAERSDSAEGWRSLTYAQLRRQGERPCPAHAPAQPLWLTTSWGSTETALAVTTVHWHQEGADYIDAPLPGLEMKLVPSGCKLEKHLRGVSVFAGYRNVQQQLGVGGHLAGGPGIATGVAGAARSAHGA